jgi:hypothetical protein
MVGGKTDFSPLQNVQVQVVGGGESRHLTSDRNGEFRVRLPVGKYVVRAFLVTGAGTGSDPRRSVEAARMA